MSAYVCKCAGGSQCCRFGSEIQQANWTVSGVEQKGMTFVTISWCEYLTWLPMAAGNCCATAWSMHAHVAGEVVCCACCAVAM